MERAKIKLDDVISPRKGGAPPPNGWTAKQVVNHLYKLVKHCEERKQYGVAGNLRIAAAVIEHIGTENDNFDHTVHFIQSDGLPDLPFRRDGDPDLLSDSFPIKGEQASGLYQRVAEARQEAKVEAPAPLPRARASIPANPPAEAPAPRARATLGTSPSPAPMPRARASLSSETSSKPPSNGLFE